MTKKKLPDLEKSLTDLEEIVELLEEGDIPLEEALKQFEKGNEKAGINILKAFINEVEAQKGKHIDEHFSDQLKEWAEAWIEDPSLAL